MTRNPANPKPRRSGNPAWRAMDLHLHTPASSDYQEPNVTYLDILQTAEKRGLDIIAFTDHNTVAGYGRLRDEIEELELLERRGRLLPEELKRLNEYRRLMGKILVLPGFEFTATFGFHILGLFSPETPLRDLEHLLLSLNVPSDQLDKGSVTVGASSDVLTAYRLISEGGGLAIAAHVNSTNGVAMRGFGFGGQTKIAFTQDPHLAALEVTDLDQKGRRTTAAFFSGSKPEYPRRMHCVMGSDAHRLHRDPNNAKNFGVGDRPTDVLIDEVSFDALRALFQGSDFARIRPHTGGGAVAAEFDIVQQAREEGASIVLDFHEAATQRGGKLYQVLADVCAMANTNGGLLYIGVSGDPKQPPVGLPDADQTVRELRAALNRMLTPQLDCTVDVQTTRGRKVVRVLVPRGADVPYAVEESKIYVREEAETSLAVRDEIVQLVLRAHGAAPAEAAAEPSPAAVPEAPPPVPALPPSTPADSRRRAGRGQPSPRQPQELPAAAADPNGLNPPKTGVEIVMTDARDGVHYHAMRDLRNNSVVKGVTRASARKLWHYAISAKENGELDLDQVAWLGDIGLWRKSLKSGTVRYDLVQRRGQELRVFYGVTEDGLHSGWRRLIEAYEAGTLGPVAGEAEAAAPAVVVETVPALPEPEEEAAGPLPAAPSEDPNAAAEPVAEPQAAPTEAEAPAPKRRSRAGVSRKTAKTAAKKTATKKTAAKKTAAKTTRRRAAAGDDD
ncbi:MAG: putative DNA binding domain-containing protein [Anaerolineales bacterium]|nr:putative DNA binding domain-containing protein [Anaerolineales bacterium]